MSFIQFYLFGFYLLLVQISCMVRYDIASITFNQLSTITRFAVTSDQKTYVIQGGSSQLMIYSANQNIFNYRQIIYQTATPLNTMAITPDGSKIFTFSTNQKLIRIYQMNLTDFTYSIFQQITPSATVYLHNNVDYYGTRIDTGNSPVLVSYLYDGTTYNLDSNSTLTSLTSGIFEQTLSPDGKYYIYGEYFNSNGSVCTIYFKIFQHVPGGLTQVYSTTFSPASTINGVFYKILVSKPIFGVYDIIIFYKFNTQLSVYYLQFDSGTNVGTLMQTIISNAISTEFGYNGYTFSYLTLNGKYFALSDTGIKQTRIYQKIANQYVKIYYYLNTSATISLSYFTENASFFISKSGGTSNSMLFFFTCNIANCAKCYWRDKCLTCYSGYQVINNACSCLDGYSNISGVCTQCSISNCATCSGLNICSSCGNGYILSGNVCVCNSPKNISTITQKCVSCNVNSCYKCSYDDNCDLFLPSQSGSSNSSSNQETKSMVAALIGLIVIIAGGIFIFIQVLGFVIFKLVKISSLMPSAVPSSNSLQAQQNNSLNQKGLSRAQLNQQSFQTSLGKEEANTDNLVKLQSTFNNQNISDSNNGIDGKKRKRRANLDLSLNNHLNDECNVQFHQNSSNFQQFTIVNINTSNPSQFF